MNNFNVNSTLILILGISVGLFLLYFLYLIIVSPSGLF